MSLPILENNPLCDGCGACCFGMGWPPFDCMTLGFDSDDPEDDPDYARLPQSLKDELDEMFERRSEIPIGSPCAWLDTGTKKCRNYEWRPATCRNFEPDCDTCHEYREEAGIEETQEARLR